MLPKGVKPLETSPLLRMASEVENALYVIQPCLRSSSPTALESGVCPDSPPSWLCVAPESECEETPDVSDVDLPEVPRIEVERVDTPPFLLLYVTQLCSGLIYVWAHPCEPPMYIVARRVYVKICFCSRRNRESYPIRITGVSSCARLSEGTQYTHWRTLVPRKTS